jgi:hypothetical protein
LDQERAWLRRFQFEISDFGFEMQDLSDFKIVPTLSIYPVFTIGSGRPLASIAT